MKLRRRFILRGLGGATMALPILPSLLPRTARANAANGSSFGIFFRQANGVACEQNTPVGDAREPERFWPREHGLLTPESTADRAISELSDYFDSLLIPDNINGSGYEYGDGHAAGALQGLTGRPPDVPNRGGDSEASGESIDHRIGRELNEAGRESLFLHAGNENGWLGAPSISHRGANSRRAAISAPADAYQLITGLDSDQFATMIARQRSINDFLKPQLDAILARPELSQTDREKLLLHQQSFRDLENGLTCNLSPDEQMALAERHAGGEGDAVLATIRSHMDVAALAVACGYTRSVAIQAGDGNDGSTRYPDLETGELMANNFHFISHRRSDHGNGGQLLADAGKQHHMIDRQFAQTFRYLLDRLSLYTTADGAPLLDAGVAVWYNDLGNGPDHSSRRRPYIIAGSGGGMLKQGQFVDLGASPDEINLPRLLGTLGSAAGLRDASGEYISDFGDPEFAGPALQQLLA